MDETISSDKSGAESGPIGEAPSLLSGEAPPKRSWIENRGLLRDEGTVLGLGGLEKGLDHKIEVIHSHFEEKKAEAQRKREQLEEKRSQLERRRSKIEKKIGLLQERIEDPPVPETQSGEDQRFSLFRYTAGLIFAGGICGFNFFLLHELLRVHFERPLLVAAGIFCTGLFALFQPTSLFFGAEQKERSVTPWKRWLTEIGMPVAASLFAVSWTYQELGLLRAGSLFLYLAMTFLLGGKLLLSTIPRLGKTACALWWDLRAWWIRRQARQKRNRLQDEVLHSLAEEEASLADQQAKIPTLPEIEARREAAAHLFRSEYAVARQATSSGFITSDVRRNVTSNNNQ